MSHAHRRPDLTPKGDSLRQCVAIGECRPRAKSSKNTRDWCRGRVGVPHVYLWEEDRDNALFYHMRGERPRFPRQRLVCFACQRQPWSSLRSHCRFCGSPPRRVYERRTYGERTYEVESETVRGTFCLCPDNFHPKATQTGGYFYDTPRVPFADDPVQIAALTAQVRT